MPVIRLNIEQRLAESIRSFGPGSLAGAVPLNIDLDLVLTVLANTVCAAMRRRLPGYRSPVMLEVYARGPGRGHPRRQHQR